MSKNIHGSQINFNSILEDCKKRFTPFEKKVEINRTPLNLLEVIEKIGVEGVKNAIISEVKYNSPTTENRSRGEPDKIALEMIEGGTCAISVLTEEKYFNGSLSNLEQVKKVSTVPVLRKDFIFNKTQISESYYYGADSLLLISSFFTESELKEMIDLSREYGMEPLVETHSKEDVFKARNAGTRLYAINNRDKDTLKLDLNKTAELAPLIDGTIVSASGIETPTDLRRILKFADAALIGSSIMGAINIKAKVQEFVRMAL